MVLEKDGMPVSDDGEMVLGVLTQIRRHLEESHDCARCEILHGNLLEAITRWVVGNFDETVNDEWNIDLFGVEEKGEKGSGDGR